MTMDDMLNISGITLADIAIINYLQKNIKANKVISYLGGGELWCIKYKTKLNKEVCEQWLQASISS